MKKGLKIWSKLLIASFFLGVTVTSAVAQSQGSWNDRGWTTTAENDATTGTQCGGRVLKVTRTQQQMLDGTEITLKFNEGVHGDAFYLVAEQGGSLAGVNGTGCPVAPNVVYGGNLAVGTITDNVFAPTSSRPTTGTTIVSTGNTIAVKAINVTDNNVENVASTYYLGVYIQDVAANNDQDPTSCYSDVYYVEIEVLSPIYASLTLNDGNPYEYICNGATTNTNIGITLCNLPADYTGIFSYKALVDNDDNTAVISGSYAYAARISADSLKYGGEAQGIWEEGVFNAGGDVDMTSGTTSALTISGITPVDRKYTVKIGRQTLTNGSGAVAGTAKYTFAEMTYSYDRGDGVIVTLPVIFESESGFCQGHTGEAYPEVFTVYVAPALETQALAYGTAERINGYTPGQDFVTGDPTAPTFCQGTLAYLFAETSANAGTSDEGDLFGATTYAWSQTAGTTLTLDATNIQAPTTSELTSTAGYTLHLVATWNDEDNNYGTTGCTAEDDINITVTPAPILLVATDETVLSDGTWNSTNVITASEVCPSNSIFINTLTDGTPVLDETGRADAIMNGNYIKHNGAEIKWTINVPTGMGAYTTWRTTNVDAEGAIAVTDPDANPDVTHYLDNESVATPGNVITYTLENAGTTANTCKLVKSDGSSLNLEADKDGKVQVKYPVSIRPTFGLAN